MENQQTKKEKIDGKPNRVKQPDKNGIGVEKDTAIVYVVSSSPGQRVILPVKGSEFSHCFDLHIGEDFTIRPNEIKVVSTGMVMEIPVGYAGLIRERSSTPVNFGITVKAGDIDSDYRGTVEIVFYRFPGVSVRQAVSHVLGTGNASWWNPFKLLWLAHKYRSLRNKPLHFSRGRALAQMEIVKVNRVKFAKTVGNQTLSKTKRSSGGFGSTTKAKDRTKDRGYAATATIRKGDKIKKIKL